MPKTKEIMQSNNATFFAPTRQAEPSGVANSCKPAGHELVSPDRFPFMNRAFATINIKTLISLPAIQTGFSSIPADSYVLDKTRFKDIARFRKLSGSVLKTSHGELFHPINANAYGGTASRAYPEIPENALEALKPVVEVFVKIGELHDGEEVLVQRQRVVCDANVSARTVQEGLHQDGVGKLALFCVRRQNVVGGISLICDAARDLVFARELEEGDILFINDKSVYHDATRVKPLDPSAPGFRDILILTWPACREVIPPYYGA